LALTEAYGDDDDLVKYIRRGEVFGRPEGEADQRPVPWHCYWCYEADRYHGTVVIRSLIGSDNPCPPVIARFCDVKFAKCAVPAMLWKIDITNWEDMGSRKRDMLLLMIPLGLENSRRGKTQSEVQELILRNPDAKLIWPNEADFEALRRAITRHYKEVKTRGPDYWLLSLP